jgi:hypothetical protein
LLEKYQKINNIIKKILNQYMNIFIALLSWIIILSSFIVSSSILSSCVSIYSLSIIVTGISTLLEVKQALSINILSSPVSTMKNSLCAQVTLISLNKLS